MSGYPKSTHELIKNKLMTVSNSDHRRFRRLITSPIIGQNLAMYLERIEDIVINSLEELSSMKHPIELVKEMKKVSFKTIVHVFMGSSNNDNIIKNIGISYTHISNALLSIPLNAPGFTFHKALKVIHFNFINIILFN
jgi:ent-kaurenoic acid hydroxylase